MAKNKLAPRWPKALRAYIVSRLAAWRPYKEIWVEVTNSDFAKTGLTPLDPITTTYDRFRLRCKRIPKHEVALAHEEWQLEVGSVKWAEDKARVQGLSELIDSINVVIEKKYFDKNTIGTLVGLIGQLRGLYEQIRKEVSADADRAALSASGTRVLLTNPKNVEINAETLSELLLVYREEVGGLHNLDLSVLNTTELNSLITACQAIIDERSKEITDAEYTIEDIPEDPDGNKAE